MEPSVATPSTDIVVLCYEGRGGSLSGAETFAIRAILNWADHGDIILHVAGGKRFGFYREMLSNESPFFEPLLRDLSASTWSETAEKYQNSKGVIIPVLTFPDWDADIVKAILYYIACDRFRFVCTDPIYQGMIQRDVALGKLEEMAELASMLGLHKLLEIVKRAVYSVDQRLTSKIKHYEDMCEEAEKMGPELPVKTAEALYSHFYNLIMWSKYNSKVLLDQCYKTGSFRTVAVFDSHSKVHGAGGRKQKLAYAVDDLYRLNVPLFFKNSDGETDMKMPIGVICDNSLLDSGKHVKMSFSIQPLFVGMPACTLDIDVSRRRYSGLHLETRAEFNIPFPELHTEYTASLRLKITIRSGSAPEQCTYAVSSTKNKKQVVEKTLQLKSYNTYIWEVYCQWLWTPRPDALFEEKSDLPLSIHNYSTVKHKPRLYMNIPQRWAQENSLGVSDDEESEDEEAVNADSTKKRKLNDSS